MLTQAKEKSSSPRQHLRFIILANLLNQSHLIATVYFVVRRNLCKTNWSFQNRIQNEYLRQEAKTGLALADNVLGVFLFFVILF